MLEYLTHLKIDKVLADLNYLYDDNKMDIDGSILIRCTNGVKGIIRASQIATGENNSFVIMIYGKKGGIKWEQENPRVLHYMLEGEEVQIIESDKINTDLLSDDAVLPPGHPDEIFDAMANIYNGAAKAINKEDDHPQSIKNLIEGLLMVKKEILNALEKNGITKIDSVNKKFDPNLHQAMMEIEDDNLDEGVVIQEIQTGYMMHDRLLRPAMVGVSKKSKQQSETEIKKDINSDESENKKDHKN